MGRLMLSAAGIKKSYGDRLLLDIDSLNVYDGDRIGLTGENGAGKSTLLSILSGEQLPDEGRVNLMTEASVIKQMGDTDAEVMTPGFRAQEKREGLSGGEKTRRRIAGALGAGAVLLFADEPTSDLDSEGTERLKRALSDHNGAILLISHDRELLNEICTQIWHLEDGKITVYSGNYDDFRRELENRRQFQQFEYEQYRGEQARLRENMQRLNEWAASVKKAPTRMGNSEARLHKRKNTNSILQLSHAKNIVENRMERMEKKERPRDLPDIKMTLGAGSPIGAKVALSVDRLTISAGARRLISNAMFTLPTGSRTALIGPNGCGKTSLLRALAGTLSEGVKATGGIRFNPAALPGRFDQAHESTLDMNKTALENVMYESVVPESDARTVLARLNIRHDDVFKLTGVLSGGERAKVALARLLVSDRNVLLLDEPTNHMDVFTLEALGGLLSGYGGTLLFVSHDTAFIRKAANRLLIIENGMLKTFDGGLDAYEQSKNRVTKGEDIKLQISTLEMRLAAIAARISAPKKGDRPDLLREEYDKMAQELMELKRRL